MDAVHLLFKQVSKLWRRLVVRNQELVVVRQRDQVAVKKPVYSARKGQAVLHDVWAPFTHSPDMSRLHFRPASAVYDAQTCDRTAVVVGVANLPPKVCVPNLSVKQNLLNAPPFECDSLLMQEYRLLDVLEAKPESKGVFGASVSLNPACTMLAKS